MTDRRRLVRRLGVWGGVAALIGVLGPWLVVHAEAAGRSLTPATVGSQRKVALVFGASVYPDGTPSPYLQGRLDVASDLYRRHAVSVVLVTGDNGTIHYDEPAGMRRYLIEHGVKATDVVEDDAGFDTYDSCVRARRIFQATSVVVVSQSYHIPRAVAACRLTGLDAVGVGDDQPKDATWWKGVAREWLANVKLMVDLATNRQPTLGKVETTLVDALARHA